MNLAAVLVCAVWVSCDSGGLAGKPSLPAKSSAWLRAKRRAYDGAPPVIPHDTVGVACISCHTTAGVQVAELGFAPPSPHKLTRGLGRASRCQQCHVFVATTSTFARNEFVGLPQDLRRGPRLYPGAPPVIPHAVFLRENCVACHSGPFAREPIRSTHPDRVRCLQCHVPALTQSEFVR